MAKKFLKDDRSIKGMIKYIVLSRTYQMSSHSDPKALEADPKNLLWHHRPPKRLQGGSDPGRVVGVIRGTRPDPLWPTCPHPLDGLSRMAVADPRKGSLDGEGRRSIYTAVRRNFLSPFMLAFDTPVPFSTMGRRNISNVPAQALILLNDPLVVQLSRA